jgi:diguanylate cyclase (GGDEF)-like protein
VDQQEFEGQDTTGSSDGRLLYLADNLASLHAAPDLPWLTGRFEFLGEHALGAVLTALLLPDEAGAYRAARSASPRPAQARALWDDLKVDSLASSPQAASALQAAATSTTTQQHSLARTFGDAAAGRDAAESVLLAPLAFNREHIGLGLFVVQYPDDLSSSIAMVIATHAAVAIFQLRGREDARRLHSVDPRLWVPDEDFLMTQLRRELTRARRYGRELGLAVLRLENEAEVRSRFGDFYADHLMRRIGGQLLASVRDTDVLGALQGAYAVIHTDTGIDGTNISAHRLRDTVVTMVTQRFPEAPAPVISVRTVALRTHGESIEDLLRLLDGNQSDSAVA